MKKIGFTLVELLAVIAILALLVIIALPNVLKMFNEAKKDSFVTEVKNIIKTVPNKYMQETLKGNKLDIISNNKNSLDLSNNDIEYNFSLDAKGNIKEMFIKKDNYCIKTSKKINEITASDISENCDSNDFNSIAGTLMKDYLSKANIENRMTVRSLTFYSDGRTINSNRKYDVSENQNGKIILYVVELSDEIWIPYGSAKLLDLIIVADGKIALPKDSSNLFSFYAAPFHGPESNFVSIEFNNSVDTKNVTNMSCMLCLNHVTSYDLTGFDTSNVSDMSSMFEVYGFDTPIEFNLSSFDTSKVIDMQYMFRKVVTNSLDLSSFDINDNANISNIFSESKINHGYAKDEKTASRLNTLLNKNVFVVK